MTTVYKFRAAPRLRSYPKGNQEVTLLIGPKGQTLQNCGELILRWHEWQELQALLHSRYADSAREIDAEVVIEGEPTKGRDEGE